MADWYIAQTKSNSHKIAEQNLNQQGFKTFLPLQDFTSRIGSRFVSSIKPLFPGYIFVSIDSNKVPWHKINNTRGVTRVICHDGIPQKLPSEIVSGLMDRCDSLGKLLPPKTLKCGDAVSVLSGSLANFVATVDAIDSERRIWVLMDIMGQLTKVHIALEQLSPKN